MASASATVADDRGYNEMHDLSARTVSLIFVLRMPTADPEITPEVVEEHGLTPEEYERIKKILGREPNFTELGIFSVMWSEHCSYKNTRRELQKFPTNGPNILVEAGEENAGIIDIGDGWAIAFKIESHNHPSAVEPFQGAATGVGGIIRDIFTMGARPVLSELAALWTDLCDIVESEISNSKLAANRRLFAGVVSGIAHYGNCFGIPTIAGEVYFDESFEGQSAGKRVLPRRVAARTNRARRGQGRRQSGLLRRRGDGARRSGGSGVCVAGSDRGIARRPAGGAGRRSVHGETLAGSVSRIARHRMRSPAFRTWARQV